MKNWQQIHNDLSRRILRHNGTNFIFKYCEVYLNIPKYISEAAGDCAWALSSRSRELKAIYSIDIINDDREHLSNDC